MKRLATLALTIIMLFVTSYQSQAYSEIEPWFEEEFKQAENEYNIIPEDFGHKILKEHITRGEFSTILIMAYKSLDYTMPDSLDLQVFTDSSNAYVNAAYQLGFVSGYEDKTFKENNSITRQEIFKMLGNFLTVTENAEKMDEEQCDRVLLSFNDRENISFWAREATAMMKYKSIVNGSTEKMINPQNNTSRIEAIVLVTRMLNAIAIEKVIYAEDNESKTVNSEVTKQKLEDVASSDEQVRGVETEVDLNNNLYRVGYNNEKREFVFGDGSEYTTGDEAFEHMINVTVDVWMIDTYGNKYPTTRTIKVNKAIEEIVKLIFKDIFEGEEQFPIKSMMAYAWRNNSTSEHRLGLAIDINPNENYMIRSSGSIVAGSYWKPNEDPYSIKENGDVVNAFAKYGFAWGGNAWRSANDYMHFSFFGN